MGPPGGSHFLGPHAEFSTEIKEKHIPRSHFWDRLAVPKKGPQNRKINRVGGPKHNTKTISTFCLFTKKHQNLEQRRPVQAKPDFKRLSGPKNGTSKRTYGIGCLCSLAPMWQLRCSTTHAAFTNASLLRLLRYSAPCFTWKPQCK